MLSTSNEMDNALSCNPVFRGQVIVMLKNQDRLIPKQGLNESVSQLLCQSGQIQPEGI